MLIQNTIHKTFIDRNEGPYTNHTDAIHLFLLPQAIAVIVKHFAFRKIRRTGDDRYFRTGTHHSLQCSKVLLVGGLLSEDKVSVK